MGFKINKDNEITEANLDKALSDVENDLRYGGNLLVLNKILNEFKENVDIKTVAMKVALIDATNSTRLFQYKSTTLQEVAQKIVSIKDFDEKVKKGDPDLVNLIAKGTGKNNITSFASKYCHYHNALVYHGDAYSKYDNTVAKVLPAYAERYEVEYNGEKVTTSLLRDKLRAQYKYEDFNDIITQILKEANVLGEVPNARAKFDYLLWYYNK